MSMVFSSNVLYKQVFSTEHDIFISLLIQNVEKNTFFGTLSLQSGDKLKLQDGVSEIPLGFGTNFDGFGIFLIDSSVPFLTGGGYGNGLGIITDNITTNLSAVSGFVMGAMYDNTGIFGQLGGVEQFTTGNVVPVPKSFVVRALSGFEFVGSEQLTLSTDYSSNWNVYRVSFKKKLQEITCYTYSNGNYVPSIGMNTGVSPSQIPSGVRIGVTWSGSFPVNVKNITINGTSL